MLKAWNGTALTLIPKVDVPSSMRDFRPIACCNVIYKCISNVIVVGSTGSVWFGLVWFGYFECDCE